MPNAHDVLFPDDLDRVARWRREAEQQEEEFARQRAAEREQQKQRTQMDARTQAGWVEWIDARVETKSKYILEVVKEAFNQFTDEQYKSFQAALDRRDHAIQALRDEVEIKIGLSRKLARLKAEIAEARQQAPNFKAELTGLQEEIAKQQKTIVHLRAENSTLEYRQKEFDGELSRMKREATSPSAVVEFETSSSRITVGNLHPDAANALREFAAQVVDAYDHDPILFSGARQLRHAS
jgi:chromosome segregation ATPase